MGPWLPGVERIRHVPDGAMRGAPRNDVDGATEKRLDQCGEKETMELIAWFWDGFFVAPALDIWNDPAYLIQNIMGGLMVGILYSLVALGYVLIYKLRASSISPSR